MRRRLTAPLAGLVVLLAGATVVILAAPGAEQCFAQAGSPSPDLEGRIACPDSAGGAPVGPGSTGLAATPAPPSGGGRSACAVNARLRSIAATRRGRGVRFGFVRRGAGRVTVDVFRVSQGSRVIGNRRVARFANRARSFAWSGRGAQNGDYFVRYRARGAETRRVALRRQGGRFVRRPDFEARDGCGAIRAFKLERPVFGGRANRALGISYRLNGAARVSVTVTRAGRTVRRFKPTSDRPGRTYRLRLAAEGLRRGDHQVRILVRPSGAAPARARLTAARL